MPTRDPPIPLSATHFLGQISIAFNHPLVLGPLANANWTGRFANQLFTVTGAGVAAGNTVNVTLVLGAVDAGPDVISFDPPPFDVISNTAKQIPAPAFVDFPIV